MGSIMKPSIAVPVLFGGGKSSYIQKVKGIQPASLITYWPMNEPSGTNADNAEGTAARDGTYTGVTLGQTGIGDGETCPLFDGANDYLDINTASLRSAFDGSELTIVMWIKMFDAGVWTDGTARRMLNISAPGSDNIRFERRTTNNVFRVIYQAGGVNNIRDITMSPTDFFSIVLTVSASADAVKVYKDGTQQGATLTGLGVWDGTPNEMKIGATNATPTDVHHGYLAHSLIWTTPLGQADITSIATV